MANKKVILGLSGGVDSAVAGYLLKQSGYDVRAVFMVNWKERGSCNWEDDLVSARAVAKHLKIPFEIWDFAKEYQEFVFDDFITHYERGLTPNPDVFCNKYIKFGVFYHRARKEGADYVATGHYARIHEARSTKHETKEYNLYSAMDKTKDQSDFLYQIKTSQLRRIMFPIGGMLKSEVKTIAKKIGLPNWDRPESMGVCFIGEMNMKQFLQRYLPSKVGNITDTKGNVVGAHDGVWYYTLGQREGLNIGGTGPYYVVGKDIRRNIVTVANEPEAGELLMVKKVMITRCNFFLPKEMLQAVSYKLPVLWRDRHLSSLQRGVLKKEKTGWVVVFNKSKRGVTPGQSLVVYDVDGERVVGGGVIAKTQ